MEVRHGRKKNQKNQKNLKTLKNLKKGRIQQESWERRVELEEPLNHFPASGCGDRIVSRIPL